MLLTSLFPQLVGFRIEGLRRADDHLTLTAVAQRKAARCPRCHRRSRRIHSRYQRHVADLPIGAMPVTLALHVRRFVCPNPRCPQRIFAERLPNLVAAGARRSQGLHAALEEIAFALGGEAGARLADALGMPASPDTLLRLIRAAPLPAIGTPLRIGVDDFALRKGRVYAGIVVDHDAHRPLDLLPDCTPTTIADWLTARPSVCLVSRDRGTAIIEGVTRGAPEAIQVADRWHLLKNLGDTLERLLVRHRAAWHDALVAEPGLPDAGAAVAAVLGEQVLPEPPWPPTVRAQQAAQERQARWNLRVARYEDVRRMHGEGRSISAIAEAMHLDRKTVRAYLTSDCAPSLRPRARKRSKLDPFRAYLDQRWEEGCHNVAVLLAELRERGYRGGHTIVQDYVAPLRPKRPQATTVPAAVTRVAVPARPTWTPRQVVALFLRRPDDLTAKQQHALTTIRTASPLLDAVYGVVQAFAVMVRQRQVDGLERFS